MRQTGCGHVEAGLHFQVHLGCSQTLWQGWDLGHCSMHIGSEQCDEQAAQSGPEQGRWGQSTAQCGSPQPILHWERSTPLQRVWHFGLSHSGLHSWVRGASFVRLRGGLVVWARHRKRRE